MGSAAGNYEACGSRPVAEQASKIGFTSGFTSPASTTRTGDRPLPCPHPKPTVDDDRFDA
jgi:hypothetical protein